MDWDLIKTICMVIALTGGITSGLVLSKAGKDTKWRSRLGYWGAAGCIMLIVGMYGSIFAISKGAL